MSEITSNTLAGSVEPELKTEASPSTPETPEVKTEDTTPTEPTAEKVEKVEEPKPKSRAKERIEHLSRELKNARRSLARANQKLGGFQAERSPREEDFADHSQYQTAVATRAAETAAVKSRVSDLDDEAQTLAAKRVEAWSDIVAEARQQMPDFDSVFNGNVPVSETMAELIMDADNPAQVAYWLGKNTHDARRIYDMSPVEAARELGRIEARLSVPKPKTVSSAPRPVDTVSGKAHATGKSPEEMTYDEYKAHRMAQIKAQRGY